MHDTPCSQDENRCHFYIPMIFIQRNSSRLNNYNENFNFWDRPTVDETESTQVRMRLRKTSSRSHIDSITSGHGIGNKLRA